MLQSDVELRCNKSRHLLFTLPQSFSQPQRAYLSHPHLSGHLPLSPHLAISRLHHTCTYLHTPAHTCTHLHSTQPLLRSDFVSTFPAPSTAHQTNPHSHRLTPTPEMISDHALADLANGLGIAAMAFIVLYHFVAVNGKRMEA